MKKLTEHIRSEAVIRGRLVALRQDRGWSMEELARRVDPPTTGSQINKLEKGTVHLTLTWVFRLSAALAVEWNELLAPLPQDERDLLELYRKMTDRSRQVVADVARSMVGTARDNNHH